MSLYKTLHIESLSIVNIQLYKNKEVMNKIVCHCVYIFIAISYERQDTLQHHAQRTHFK